MSLPEAILALTAGVSDDLTRLPWGGPPPAARVAAVLAAQRAAIPAVGRFLDAEGVDADAPWWRHAVPTTLFRRTLLFAGSEADSAAIFASSGTTDPARRSRAAYSDAGLALMTEAIRVNAERMLFPDGRTTRVLVLAPPPEAAPAMIMAWGMARLVERFGLPGSRFLVGATGLDAAAVVAELEAAARDGIALTVIGASFGFVHLLDGLAAKGWSVRLPPGSRTLDAGGFKGRSREVSRTELRGMIAERLGIPEERAVNLLGMTELASQLYDDGIAALAEGRAAAPAKVNPPWTATVAVDPLRLEPLPDGEPGLLVHLDLANVERPAVIRTDDVGFTAAGGFEVTGRVPGADAAGCSLSIDDLLAAG